MPEGYNKAKFVAELADVFSKNAGKVRAIDFYIGGGNRLHVTGEGLLTIGQLIRSGRVPIEVDDERLKREQAGAMYDPKTNSIIVPSDWTQTPAQARESFETFQKYSLNPEALEFHERTFRGTAMQQARLVHEATHALLDYHGTNVYRARTEAAAWLAGAIFLYQLGSISHALPDSEHTDAGIWKVAHAVALAQRLYGKMGARLWRRDIQPLLVAIRDEYGIGLVERSGLDGID